MEKIFPKSADYGRWVNITALTEHLHGIPIPKYEALPFHTRGRLRMVPPDYVAHILTLAASDFTGKLTSQKTGYAVFYFAEIHEAFDAPNEKGRRQTSQDTFILFK